MSELQIYMQEEGLAAAGRVRQKVLAAAAAGAGFSTVWAVGTQRRLIRTVPSVTSNVAIGMAAFAVCQEGVRALRQGDHDAWNSFWAGAATGAVLTRSAYGRGFHLLGLVMWGPLCGSLHWLNSTLQPAAAIGSMLASQGLLDMPQQDHEEAAAAAEAPQQMAAAVAAAAAAGPVQPRRLEELSHREKKQAVELIRQREIAELNEALKQRQLQEAARAAGRGSSSSGEQEQPRKRWWLFG
ncbi:hypothetical protein COO60DRAFT_531653 [Scenedesmus sp. NREL 46B-D3]|nr:hypothetical protein COO60DRAFT_531653 [Scenedesmus sp. NREL 46B-D3]